jgi:hypothetical protein
MVSSGFGPGRIGNPDPRERKPNMKYFVCEGKQIILHSDGTVCSTRQDLLHSPIFHRIYALYIEKLRRRNSPLLAAFPGRLDSEDGEQELKQLLDCLCEMPAADLPDSYPNARVWRGENVRESLLEFVEGLYDFWRTFDRFLVLHSDPGPEGFDRKPYRWFNETTESLTHLIRSTYRDVCENISGDHPRVYRQVAAGCDVGLIAAPRQLSWPREYGRAIGQIPFIRQVWIAPPLIIDPPMNKRSREFRRIDRNPLAGADLKVDEWLCYPAQVGPLVILIYFHRRFMGLGCSLANLFELASDHQLQDGPDALFFFGMPAEAMNGLGDPPTVFFDDGPDHPLVAAVPGEDRFGYFGYLKKMTLTLHNVAMMKKGRMPFHGAMARIMLKSGRVATVVMMGDTATGKSETLEAFRVMGGESIRDMRVIADDMGSLAITPEGRIAGYGTEIGAFVRLDDLQQGYAFSQLDRAIIMSPQKTNSRAVMPVTTVAETLRGYPVDFLLYANNYEEPDGEHPILDRFESADRALAVFREGAAMSKGTTTSSGLVHTYFANVFGPSQYKAEHEALAESVFRTAFERGVWVGQIRTRLGIPGCELEGPRKAAGALLELLDSVT